ncbi:MAG: cryptochrome/photolyase family protein, partial [Chitinophagaceae bacterium]|nr:cryptochrome/photolyase family protein [Chitinophagaceae bacterium]
MDKAGIVFPHQLFEQNVLTSSCSRIYLVEERLFFRHYHFHKRKIAFHRAGMKFYEQYLLSKKIEVVYVEAFDELADVRKLIPHLKSKGVHSLEYIDTSDCWLEQRLKSVSGTQGIHLIKHESPMFLNSQAANAAFFSDRKRMFQTDFYKQQRQSRNILMENRNT